MAHAFNLTIHMVASLDGFIAKKDNSVGWFETADHYEKGATVTAQDATAFLKTIDCYVMGSRTYEHALELSKSYGWPYGDLPTIVVSQRELITHKQNIELYSGNLNNLVKERLKPYFHNVWVVGGAILAQAFLRLNLADEIRLSILPIILGEGQLLFDQIAQEKELHLKDATAYKNGMVELLYAIKK